MPAQSPKRKQLFPPLKWLLFPLLLYAALAYFAAPFLWRKYEAYLAHPASGLRSTTPAGIPGDPINIALIGSSADIDGLMAAAGWYRADPIGTLTSLRLARSILFGTAYNTAPVSTLLYQGRRQDRAFEKPIGNDADRRHHVRFWQSQPAQATGAQLWYGAASEDIAVGLNHLTGQLTHHIAPNIDSERDRLLADLTATRRIGAITWQTGIGAVALGHNGEYDRFFTDGKLALAIIVPTPGP